jgi:RimJ/RimL family protein N-acetyltransferase
MIKLRPIELDDLEQIRKWRQGKGYMLRTESDITAHSQQQWYENVVSNRDSKIKFWAIYKKETEIYFPLLGYCSLDFDFINGQAELGLLIGDEYQKQGYGMQVVDMLINKAFNEFRMHSVFFECYKCNPAIDFWEKVCIKYKIKGVALPMRKFWKNVYYSSSIGTIINEK